MSRDMEAAQRIRDLMAKPDAEDWEYENDENFCRWDVIPSIYGGYDVEFDRVMLVLLRDLRDGTFKSQRFGLATDILREMLCVQDLCDYGSSPRVCFPTREFEEILPELIARWEAQAQRDWGTRLGDVFPLEETEVLSTQEFRLKPVITDEMKAAYRKYLATPDKPELV